MARPTLEELQHHYARVPSTQGFARKCSMNLPIGLEGMRILDVGCRRGKGVVKLAHRTGASGYVLGIDWMPSHLDQARAYVKEREPDPHTTAPMEFREGYPEALDAIGIEDVSFDAAFINSSMNLFYDIEQALAELARVLVPEGLLVVDSAFANAPRDAAVVKRARELDNSVQSATYLADFLELLDSQGFEILSLQEGSLVDPHTGFTDDTIVACADADENLEFRMRLIQARRLPSTRDALLEEEGWREAQSPAPAQLPDDLVYLDNAATTRPYDHVLDVLDHAMREHWGNPSSRHVVGQRAKDLLEECRSVVAQAIGAKPEELYFTSGATESNNIAIEGRGALRAREAGPGCIITSDLEHAAVTKPIRSLKREGWNVHYVAASRGNFDLANLETILRNESRVDLISIMAVQNEFGYIFPTAEIGRLRRELAPQATFHVDGVQALGKIPVHVGEWDCDMLTFCSHKIGGPKGIGALYVRKGTDLFTTALGGGQERGLRSGTQALPLIMGFTEAVRIVLSNREQAFRHVGRLRGKLVEAIANARPDAIMNSRDDGSPFIVSVSIPDTRNKMIIKALSDQGICISGASACSSNHATVTPGTWRDKHPLSIQYAGIPRSLTGSTYRISMRDTTTEADVEKFLTAFLPLVAKEEK